MLGNCLTAASQEANRAEALLLYTNVPQQLVALGFVLAIEFGPLGASAVLCRFFFGFI